MRPLFRGYPPDVFATAAVGETTWYSRTSRRFVAPAPFRMSRTTGIVSPASGVSNPKSGRAVDGKLVLWTDKGEPRIVRPLRIENKKLFVDGESLLSLGARAELELPPVQDDEPRPRVRVEIVYANPGKGSTTLPRGMLLAFPEMDEALLVRVQALLDSGPRSGPVAEPREGTKSAKDEETVYSKVPIDEAAAARPTPEATRRSEGTRTESTRRARRPKSNVGWLLVIVLPVLVGVGYVAYQVWLDRQGDVPKVPENPTFTIPKHTGPPPTQPAAPLVDPRYSAFLAPAREAAAALREGEAQVLEAKLAAAEKALGDPKPEPASLHGLRAGRTALRLRDTALDDIAQARSLEGTRWGKGASTPYRTKESFLKAEEARITMIKTQSADLAEAVLAILNAPEPAKAETDGALQDRIERVSKNLELRQ